MAKSIRANLELASEKDVVAICKIDAAEVSSQPDKYVKANLLGYYVLVNSWLMLIQQWSKYGWTFVLNWMKTKGLFDVIRQFDCASAELIRGTDMSLSIARALYRDVCSSVPIFGVPTIAGRNMHIDATSAMLLILRYGKRFSPLQADKLRTASLDNFVEMQRKLTWWQRQPECEFINSYVREELTNILDWDALCRKLDAVDITDIVFTPGVTFDTKADLVSKLRRVAEEAVEYFPQPFGLPLVAHKGCEAKRYWGKYTNYEVHSVRISAVPKNYKTARIIAPEDVVRQAFARRYFQIMDKFTPDLIKLHDQTYNQELALRGSIDGSLATIDLSSASDSITWTLLNSVLPQNIRERLARVLPTHYVYKDRERMLQSAATMGNSVTFWLESVVFAGIASAATKWYKRYGDECSDVVSVYGDDIVVPAKAAPTVMEWLERLGFTVNIDKSFYNLDGHYFRESCGEEYYDGFCVSSVYFPRFPLDGQLGGPCSKQYYRDGFTGVRVDTMTSLLDLQHKLFGICVPASALIAELVHEADPRMTSSGPDEGFSDLYDYESRPVVVAAPAGQIIDGKMKKLVVEGMVREAHSGPIYAVPSNAKTNISADDALLVDLYNYLQFLKHGPRYDSPLDELLGISAPPISYAEARLDGEIKWVLIK